MMQTASRWGEAGPLNAQYVVQPWEEVGHRHRAISPRDRWQ